MSKSGSPSITMYWLIQHWLEGIFDTHTKKNIPILSHPPYSPGLAPCGFFSLPKIKTYHFSTVEKVQSSATRTLNSLLYEGLQHSCEEWKHLCNHCVQSQGTSLKVIKPNCMLVLLLLFCVCINGCFWKSFLLLLGSNLVPWILICIFLMVLKQKHVFKRDECSQYLIFWLFTSGSGNLI